MDLIWDCNTRDCPRTVSGDFETTVNSSVQNGGIILESRCAILTQPIIGIGFNSQVIGGDIAQATFQLNRAVSQVKADNGAASWKPIPPPPNQQFDFELSVQYPNS